MKNRALIVVQCRYESSRLPGKALYPLCGTPILVFLLRRLQTDLVKEQHCLVLATTTTPQDDIIADWGKEEGVPVVRGEEENVLRRYIQCLERYPVETVVRVTADNPLTCPEILKWHIREKEEKRVEYVQYGNLPYGSGVDVFSSDLLKFLDEKITEPDEREHINLHILRNPERFQAFFPNIEGKLARPDLRVTIDTREDWEHLRALFTPEEVEPWRISLEEVITRMDSSAFRA